MLHYRYGSWWKTGKCEIQIATLVTYQLPLASSNNLTCHILVLALQCATTCKQTYAHVTDLRLLHAAHIPAAREALSVPGL